MALKNVQIPLNIKDYPTMNDNSGSVYIGVDSLLNSSSSNQNLVTITNYLPSDQSFVNISKMINGIIVGPTTNLSNIQNSIIVGSVNISSSSLAGSQVSVSNILAVGSYLEIPNASNCAILGVGNDPDVQNPLFIIGNGITYSSNHNIVEVTTDSVHISPSRSNAVTVDITGTGVNITGDTTITGELRVSEIYEDDSADNINFRNNAVFHTGVTFNDNINLQNNNISGGATLTGTYTFTQTPAPSKVVLPAKSYMITDADDNKIMTASAVASSTMSIHHIFMRNIQFDDDEQVYLDDNSYLYMQLHLKSKTSIVNTYLNLFSFNLEALKRALGTFVDLGFCIPIYSIKVKDINRSPIVGSNISSISFINSNWGYIGKITMGDPDFYLHLPITYASTLETRNAFNIESFEGYYYVQ